MPNGAGDVALGDLDLDLLPDPGEVGAETYRVARLAPLIVVPAEVGELEPPRGRA